MPDPVLPPVQFREAIDFLKAKVRLPTKASTDLFREQHGLGFVVAGAQKAALLADFQNALVKALEEGTTLEAFRTNFDEFVKRHGWSYKGKRGWRTRIIYNTNLRTAHAAGRWAQIERNKKRRPYLRYISVKDERTRKSHKAWHGLIYPVDHEFWNEHYPPNGWGCRCRVQSLSERDLKRQGYSVSTTMPPGGRVTHTIKRGGVDEVVTAPPGIDPAWSYNVGRNRLSGITPPPAPGIPAAGNGPAATVPLPAPRKFDADKLLPESGLSEEEYARAFLKEFGGDIGKQVSFIDKVGEALPISEELFKNTTGEWKINKSGRSVYLRMLAASVKEPDEIWFDWHRKQDGAYELRRRYISRFEIDRKQQVALTVFEVSPSGWREVTNFAPKNDKGAEKQNAYIEQQRHGALMHRRKK